MLKCPVCNQPGVSYLRKVLLEPNRSTPCQACGAELTISWKGTLISFGFIIAALLIILSIPAQPWIRFIAIAAALIIYLFLDAKLSPLIKKEPKAKKTTEEKPAE
jgi:hypothetical protein